jgi:hypothetical protein
MPSSIRTRYTNAARHVADQMGATINILETASDQHEVHPDARYAYRAVALELRRLSRIVMGDIGDPAEQEEWEIEPLTVPVPEQPKVPA